ncbi:MAG: hypothetical protein ACYTE8_12355 [Planctomycetota bacterium]
MRTRTPIITAIKCFEENVNLFSDPATKPEQYNLYNGLSNLAEAVYELQKQVQALSQEVESLRRKLP